MSSFESSSSSVLMDGNQMELNTSSFFQSELDEDLNVRLVENHNAVLSATQDMKKPQVEHWKHSRIELPPPISVSSQSFYAMYNVSKFLCGRTRQSDVCFLVGNNSNSSPPKLFYAHRLILGASSQIFKHILYNPTLQRYHMLLDPRWEHQFQRKQKFEEIAIPHFSPHNKLLIRLPHVSADVFSVAQKYMYSDFGKQQQHNIILHDEELIGLYAIPPEVFLSVVDFSLTFDIACLSRAVSSQVLTHISQNLMQQVLCCVNVYSTDSIDEEEQLCEFGKFVRNKPIPDSSAKTDYRALDTYFQLLNPTMPLTQTDNIGWDKNGLYKVLQTNSMKEQIRAYIRGHGDKILETDAKMQGRPHPLVSYGADANAQLLELFSDEVYVSNKVQLDTQYRSSVHAVGRVFVRTLKNPEDAVCQKILDNLTGKLVIPVTGMTDSAQLMRLQSSPGKDLLSCTWKFLHTWLSDPHTVMAGTLRFQLLCRWATRQVFSFLYARYGSKSAWYEKVYKEKMDVPELEAFTRAFFYDSCLVRAIGLLLSATLIENSALENITVEWGDFCEYKDILVFQECPPIYVEEDRTKPSRKQDKHVLLEMIHAVLKPCLYLVDLKLFNFNEAEQLLVPSGLLSNVQQFNAQATGKQHVLLESINGKKKLTRPYLTHGSVNYGWLQGSQRFFLTGTDWTVPGLANYVYGNVAFIDFYDQPEHTRRHLLVIANNPMRPLRMRPPTLSPLRQFRKHLQVSSETPFLSSWRVYSAAGEENGQTRVVSGVCLIPDLSFTGMSKKPSVTQHAANPYGFYGVGKDSVIIDNRPHLMNHFSVDCTSKVIPEESGVYIAAEDEIEKLHRVLWNPEPRINANVRIVVNDALLQYYQSQNGQSHLESQEHFRKVVECTYDNSTQQLYLTVGLDTNAKNEQYHSTAYIRHQQNGNLDESFDEDDHVRYAREEVRTNCMEVLKEAESSAMPTEIKVPIPVGRFVGLSDEECYAILLQEQPLPSPTIQMSMVDVVDTPSSLKRKFATIQGFLTQPNKDVSQMLQIVPFFPQMKPLQTCISWNSMKHVGYTQDSLSFLKLLYLTRANYKYESYSHSQEVLRNLQRMHFQPPDSPVEDKTVYSPLNIPLLGLLGAISSSKAHLEPIQRYQLQNMKTVVAPKPIKPEIVVCVNTLSIALTDVTATCHELLCQLVTVDIPNVAAMLLNGYTDVLKKRMVYEMGVREEQSNEEYVTLLQSLVDADITSHNEEFTQFTGTMAEIIDLQERITHSFTKNTSIPISNNTQSKKTRNPDNPFQSKTLLVSEENAQNIVNDILGDAALDDIWEELPENAVSESSPPPLEPTPAAIVTRPAISVIPHGSDALYPDNGGIWSCHDCTADNLASVENCFVCNADRFRHYYSPPFLVQRRELEALLQNQLHSTRPVSHFVDGHHGLDQELSDYNRQHVQKVLTLHRKKEEEARRQHTLESLVRMMKEKLRTGDDILPFLTPLLSMDASDMQADVGVEYVYKVMRLFYQARAFKDIPIEARKDLESIMDVYTVRMNLILGKLWFLHDLTARFHALVHKTSMFTSKSLNIDTISCALASPAEDATIETHIAYKDCSMLTQGMAVYGTKTTMNTLYSEYRGKLPIRQLRKFTGKGLQVIQPVRTACLIYNIDRKGMDTRTLHANLMTKRGVRSLKTKEQVLKKKVIQKCLEKLTVTPDVVNLVNQYIDHSHKTDAETSVVDADTLRATRLTAQLVKPSVTSISMLNRSMETFLVTPQRDMSAYKVCTIDNSDMQCNSSIQTEQLYMNLHGLVFFPDETDINLNSEQLQMRIPEEKRSINAATYVTQSMQRSLQDRYSKYASRFRNKFNKVLKYVQRDMKSINDLFDNQINGTVVLPEDIDWVDELDTLHSKIPSKILSKILSKHEKKHEKNPPSKIQKTISLPVEQGDVVDDQDYSLLFPVGYTSFEDDDSKPPALDITMYNPVPNETDVIPHHIRNAINQKGPLSQLSTKTNFNEPCAILPLRHIILSIPAYKSYLEKVFLYARNVAEEEVQHKRNQFRLGKYARVDSLMTRPFEFNVTLCREYGTGQVKLDQYEQPYHDTTQIGIPEIKLDLPKVARTKFVKIEELTESMAWYKSRSPYTPKCTLTSMNDQSTRNFWFRNPEELVKDTYRNTEDGATYVARRDGSAWLQTFEEIERQKLYECFAHVFENTRDMVYTSIADISPIHVVDTLNNSRSLIRQCLNDLKVHTEYIPGKGKINLKQLLENSRRWDTSDVVLPVHVYAWKTSFFASKVPRLIKSKPKPYVLNAQLFVKDSVYYSVQQRRAHLMYDRMLYHQNQPSSGQSEEPATHSKANTKNGSTFCLGTTQMIHLSLFRNQYFIPEEIFYANDAKQCHRHNVDVDTYFHPRSCCVDRVKRTIAWAKARLLLALAKEGMHTTNNKKKSHTFESYLDEQKTGLIDMIEKQQKMPIADVSNIELDLNHVRELNTQHPSICHNCYGIGRTYRLLEAQALAKFKAQAVHTLEVTDILSKMKEDAFINIPDIDHTRQLSQITASIPLTTEEFFDYDYEFTVKDLRTDIFLQQYMQELCMYIDQSAASVQGPVYKHALLDETSNQQLVSDPEICLKATKMMEGTKMVQGSFIEYVRTRALDTYCACSVCLCTSSLLHEQYQKYEEQAVVNNEHTREQYHVLSTLTKYRPPPASATLYTIQKQFSGDNIGKYSFQPTICSFKIQKEAMCISLGTFYTDGDTSMDPFMLHQSTVMALARCEEVRRETWRQLRSSLPSSEQVTYHNQNVFSDHDVVVPAGKQQDASALMILEPMRADQTILGKSIIDSHPMFQSD